MAEAYGGVRNDMDASMKKFAVAASLGLARPSGADIEVGVVLSPTRRGATSECMEDAARGEP